MKPNMNTTRKIIKRSLSVVAALASVVVISACAATGTSGTPSDTPSATPVVYDTAPLTGVQYVQGSNPALAGPSVACKVDNLDVARPQVNLNQTDIVFDEMVEGGLTRFVAVFHSHTPDKAGPVRSIRPMDPDIISPFGGIVCYSGGQLKFVKMMQATNVFNANETEEQNKGTFTRVSDREAPHNVIVNIGKLQAAHPDLAPPSPLFQFAKDAAGSSAALSGKSVDLLKVYFPSALAQWTPSTDRSQWLRTQDGKTDTDAVTGQQLHATNVVVLSVSIDRQYGYVPKTVMVSSGKAWVLSAGQYIEATWSKASQTAPIVLTDASGSPVLLAPGNTWVELMPKAPEGKMKLVETPVAKPNPTPTK
jgi:hypothetical protein